MCTRQEENWDLASHQLQNAERLFREIGNEKAAKEAARLQAIAAERAQAKEKSDKLRQPSVRSKPIMCGCDVGSACPVHAVHNTARKRGALRSTRRNQTCEQIQKSEC
jgi:hypothetical protein